MVRRILQRAAAFLPQLGGDPEMHPSLKARVGLRPLARQGLPRVGVVGAVGGGLWVAAGHEGSGLTLGLATGELLRLHVLPHDEAHAATVPPLLRAALLSEP